MRPLKYISLFSGVEAATLAWERLGWEPVAFAEVDPFPAAVLAHRYPDIPNYDEKQKEALRRKVRKWSKDCPDGPRYKACGNAFAVPVVAWLGERIQMVDGLVGE